MGSRDRCEQCNGLMVPDYDLLQNGEIIPVTRCVNCGRRPIPPPLCTEPTRDPEHYRAFLLEKSNRHKKNGNYSGEADDLGRVCTVAVERRGGWA